MARLVGRERDLEPGDCLLCVPLMLFATRLVSVQETSKNPNRRRTLAQPCYKRTGTYSILSTSKVSVYCFVFSIRQPSPSIGKPEPRRSRYEMHKVRRLRRPPLEH